MEIAELSRLELKLDHLLQMLHDLQAENSHLRNQIARHAREKNLWYQNNRYLVGKIKKIISNLQEAMT